AEAPGLCEETEGERNEEDDRGGCPKQRGPPPEPRPMPLHRLVEPVEEDLKDESPDDEEERRIAEPPRQCGGVDERLLHHLRADSIGSEAQGCPGAAASAEAATVKGMVPRIGCPSFEAVRQVTW